MSLGLYLIAAFAFFTTVSQTAMDVAETLLWIYFFVWLRKNPHLSWKPIRFLILTSLGLVTISAISLSSFWVTDFKNAFIGLLEWRWIFTLLILIQMLIAYSHQLIKFRRIMLAITFVLLAGSLAHYWQVQGAEGRADGFIGCMPLGHNLILWAGWLMFELWLRIKSRHQGADPSLAPSMETKADVSQRILARETFKGYFNNLKSVGSRVTTLILASMLLIFTGTRGAWIGFAFAVIVIGLFSLRRYPLQTLLLLLALSGFAYQMPSIRYRLAQTSVESDYSTRSRLYFWQGYLQLFKEHPAFGAGYPLHKFLFFEKLPEEKQKYIVDSDPGLRTAHAHNQPIYILSGLGIFGFVLYYTIMLSPVLLFLLPQNQADRLGLSPKGLETYRSISLPLLASILGFNVASLTEASLSIAKNRSLYIFILAVLWVLYVRPKAWLNEPSNKN